MERREIEELQAFLGRVGQPSLLDYLGLAPTADDESRETALKKRRAWAQGQQSNPKYRTEALFLIKNLNLFRRALLDERDSFAASPAADQVKAKLDELGIFLTGALHAEGLTPQAEAAVKLRGRQLGLSETAIDERIDEQLQKLGVRRLGSELDLPSSARSLDYYEVLRAPPTASAEDLEQAYRARYRWVRNLRDPKRSSEILAQLDEAWRVLRDPERRAAYDEFRQDTQEVTDEVKKRAREIAARRAAEDGADPEISLDPDAAVPDEAAPLLLGRAVQLPPVALEREPEGPPTPDISGRTLGLSDAPQTVRERAPRLSVAGMLQLRLDVPARRPVQHKLLVQNVGQGKMRGRVTSDVPWLMPRADQLDETSREQFVVVEVEPRAMPRRQAVGHVTVVAEHGERRVIEFTVTRERNWAGWLILAFLLLVGAAAATWVLVPSAPEPPAAEP